MLRLSLLALVLVVAFVNADGEKLSCKKLEDHCRENAYAYEKECMKYEKDSAKPTCQENYLSAVDKCEEDYKECFSSRYPYMNP